MREAAIRSKAGEEGKFSVSMGWLERWLAGRGGNGEGKPDASDMIVVF